MHILKYYSVYNTFWIVWKQSVPDGSGSFNLIKLLYYSFVLRLQTTNEVFLCLKITPSFQAFSLLQKFFPFLFSTTLLFESILFFTQTDFLLFFSLSFLIILEIFSSSALSHYPPISVILTIQRNHSNIPSNWHFKKISFFAIFLLR